MIPIIFAALCVAVATAESSSVSSQSTVPSNMREYEYPSTTYLNSKPNYSDLSTTSYVSSGSSPYAKSDSRLYAAAESNSDSSSSSNSNPSTSSTSTNSQSESRASSPGLSSVSYYKTKYANDAVVNSLRPSAFHTGSSSSSSSDVPSNHYPSNDYPSANDYPTSSSSFTSGNYGQREQHHHQHHHQQHAYEMQQQQPEYVGTRPTATIYGTYAGAEYPAQQSRPAAYSTHSDYLHHPHYPTAEDYPSSASSAPHYKTYIMNGSPSYPSTSSASSSSTSSNKYSTVLGAIKSLFGGGSGGPMLSDAASNAATSHLTSYSPFGSSPTSYYSPGLMHTATHHMPVSASAPAAAAVGPAPPSYYLGSGLSPSTAAYTKSYAPMRLMSGYGGSGSPGSKVIVVRDSANAHLGASYPATAGLLMTSSSSFPVKSKISFGPSSGGPSYIPSSSSLQSYVTGPPSSSYPTSYSSSGNSYPGSYSSSGNMYPGSYTSTSNFAGGSPFLGYSM